MRLITLILCTIFVCSCNIESLESTVLITNLPSILTYDSILNARGNYFQEIFLECVNSNTNKNLVYEINKHHENEIIGIVRIIDFYIPIRKFSSKIIEGVHFDKVVLPDEYYYLVFLKNNRLFLFKSEKIYSNNDAMKKIDIDIKAIDLSEKIEMFNILWKKEITQVLPKKNYNFEYYVSFMTVMNKDESFSYVYDPLELNDSIPIKDFDFNQYKSILDLIKYY